MRIQTSHGVFPDYLTCSYHPDHFPEVQLRDYFLDIDATVCKKFDESWRCPTGEGLARFHRKSRFTLVTFSGAFLSHIMRIAACGHLLQALTFSSHRVTRLDLAIDISHEDVTEVQNTLELAWSRARRGSIRLGRKSVPRNKSRRIQTVRQDNATTGTVYIGDRKDRYHAKVYDKRAERAERKDIDIMTELVRVEVTAARGTASLRDFLEPDALFFYLASPDLIVKPDDVEEWSHTPMDPLSLPPLTTLTDHEKMIRLIERSPDIETLKMLIDKTPSELPLVLRKLEAALRPVSTARGRDAEAISDEAA